MEWILIIVVVVIALLVVAKIFRSSSKESYCYKMRGPLFTKAERSFFGVLEQAVTDDFRVLGKVRVADILSPEKGMNRSEWQIAFNMISAKHFDYVVCNKEDLSVAAVIELDDKSHNNQRNKARDEIIERACESAGLVLIRFPAKRAYEVTAVRNSIIERLARAEETETLNKTSQRDASKAGAPA